MKFTRILFGLMLPIIACKDNSADSSAQSVSQIDVIYEIEYINFAWGYQHRGYYIQNDGYLYSYDYARTGDIWRDSSKTYYSEQELIAKFSHNDTLRKVIPLDTLRWSRALAEMAKSGVNSDTMSAGRDMGAFLYTVYFYEPEVEKYYRLTLRMDGDWTFHNTSESAVELVNWLKRTIWENSR